MSKIITTDSHRWLNGQASVDSLPLAENKIGTVSPVMSRLTPGLLATKVGVHRLMEMWSFSDSKEIVYLSCI